MVTDQIDSTKSDIPPKKSAPKLARVKSAISSCGSCKSIYKEDEVLENLYDIGNA